MEETLTEQYIETARAKGLRPVVIRDRHAARNALLPVLSKLVTSLPYLLAGLVIIEQSVNWNGIGSLLFDAVVQQDLPIVMGVLVVIGLVVLVCRFILELAYDALDPRMRRTA
jgi:peptide/nickel transport system permease protein